MYYTSDIEKKSIINQEYQQPMGLVKSRTFDLENAAYFSVNASSIEALTDAGFSEKAAVDLVNNGIWQIRLQTFRENHIEGKFIQNTMADTYAAFGTETMPIQVGLQGFLYETVDQDHRLDVLKVYYEHLRGSELHRQKLLLELVIKDTVMCIRPQTFTLSTTTQKDGWVDVGVSGVAFKYRVMGFKGDKMLDSSPGQHGVSAQDYEEKPGALDDPEVEKVDITPNAEEVSVEPGTGAVSDRSVPDRYTETGYYGR